MLMFMILVTTQGIFEPRVFLHYIQKQFPATSKIRLKNWFVSFDRLLLKESTQTHLNFTLILHCFSHFLPHLMKSINTNHFTHTASGKTNLHRKHLVLCECVNTHFGTAGPVAYSLQYDQPQVIWSHTIRIFMISDSPIAQNLFIQLC